MISGPFGFLVDTESGIYGNQGLMDQRLAMKWVQRNIGAFGGNKNKVIIHNLQESDYHPAKDCIIHS